MIIFKIKKNRQTWESQAGGNTRHCCRDQMVQVTISWGGQLQGAEANVVQSLVIDAVGLVGVLDQLMHGQGGVVGLDNGIGDLWRWHHRESVHDSVWVFFANFGDQESAHTRSSTTAQRMSQLKTL
jgi:hypothetical protein